MLFHLLCRFGVKFWPQTQTTSSVITVLAYPITSNRLTLCNYRNIKTWSKKIEKDEDGLSICFVEKDLINLKKLDELIKLLNKELNDEEIDNRLFGATRRLICERRNMMGLSSPGRKKKTLWGRKAKFAYHTRLLDLNDCCSQLDSQSP